MLKYYFFLSVFWVFLSVNGQSVLRYNKDSFTFKQLNDTLKVANREDGTYQQFLQLYLKKAKKEQHTKHLFEAYYKLSGYEVDPQKAHSYTDSLLNIAQKLPDAYYVRALQTKATNYYYQKDYINSLNYELQALHKINKEKEPYAYYKSIYSVGLVYFHIQEYDKAYRYFNQARVYYQKSTDYSHVQGYFNALYREAFALYYLNNYAESTQLLQTGLNKKNLLRADDVTYKLAYFNYVLALNRYRQKNYTESIALLKNQINVIASNNDFANLATVYYYMGLNYQQLNSKDEAVAYFKKTDAIFKDYNYSNPEVKDAYTYLINYYKEQTNLTQQLFYTNQLINVTQFLQQEYKQLNKILHHKFDTKELLAAKADLEKELQKQNAFTSYLAGGAVLIVLFLGGMVLYNNRKKHRYLENYNALLKKLNIQTAQNTVTDPIYQVVPLKQLNNLSADEWTKYQGIPQKQTKAKVKNIISKKLWNDLTNWIDTFEKEEQFLQALTLNDLVNQWQINRTYISSYINQTKGKQFTQYLNDLRINYFLKVSATDKKWYFLKIEAIAEALGFSNARSFSKAFEKSTKMPISFYLKKETSKRLVDKQLHS